MPLFSTHTSGPAASHVESRKLSEAVWIRAPIETLPPERLNPRTNKETSERFADMCWQCLNINSPNIVTKCQQNAFTYPNTGLIYARLCVSIINILDSTFWTAPDNQHTAVSKQPTPRHYLVHFPLLEPYSCVGRRPQAKLGFNNVTSPRENPKELQNRDTLVRTLKFPPDNKLLHE